jgi:hypothetical protein
MPSEVELAREHLQTVLRYERLPRNSPRRVAPQLVGLAAAYSWGQGYSKEDILEMVRLALEAEELMSAKASLNGSGET